MFQQLNADEGITIILVTHDPEVARHARRIIHIHDGVIADGAANLGPVGQNRPQGTAARSTEVAP